MVVVASASSGHVEDGINVVLVRVLLRMMRVGVEGWWDGPIASGVTSVWSSLMQTLMERWELVIRVVAR